ncbi:hypothetical protein BGZ60DRAFT_12907 [Tricladium varicosporioides]|nr:hypothetical protein BGZ60DRAFT_12907 [Hymenoscyphus varicosporioides]
MLRSNSSSKWKQVLGFDDGSIKEKTPAKSIRQRPKSIFERPKYSDMPEVVPDTAPEAVPVRAPQLTLNTDTVLAVIPSYPRLPRDITFYRKKGDVLLSPSPPAPSPNDLKPLPSPPHLFYISIQEDDSPFEFNPQPDVLLHTGPAKDSPILSYVEFQSASMKADITLCPCTSSTSQSPQDYRSANFQFSPSPDVWADSSNSNIPKPRTERLSPTGGMFSAEKFSFSHTLPRSFVRERFEWRYSSGPFIRTSNGTKESGGLKLVRVTTGETVAVYAGLGGSSRPTSSKRVLGMFRFLSGEGLVNLGEEFEFLAVMSILAVVEKSRRALVVQKAAFGIK